MKLAITGFSRSGTTALTDLLNLDPRIKISYETRFFLGQRPNVRRKWNDRNRELEAMPKAPIYTGDKTTRPYLENFGTVQKQADKVIFCLRDPRDIFRSKYWNLIDADPVREYIRLMNHVLEYDLSSVFFVRYEWAVNNVNDLIQAISGFLGLDPVLDITGHNYKPVRRLGWKKHSDPGLPFEVWEIMRRFAI